LPSGRHYVVRQKSAEQSVKAMNATTKRVNYVQQTINYLVQKIQKEGEDEQKMK